MALIDAQKKEKNFKSGFITIVGRPNVGKSTFLNQVLGQKIAIMSDKAQTTRNKIQGVYTTDQAQYIFVDTPGIHKPKHKLGTFMTNIALNTLNQVDVVLFMVNAEQKLGPGDRFIMEHLKKVKQPVLLVINKIDLISKEKLFEIIATYNKEFDFKEIVPISALTGENVTTLIKTIYDQLEEGPQYYPSDQITDHPERFIISELIREKVLLKTREEIPHSVAVVIDDISKEEDKEIIDVHASVIVERPSQKSIIIGKRGSMLKDIGTMARKDIQDLLGSKVFLDLWVKVLKDWRNKQIHLNDFGYKEKEY